MKSRLIFLLLTAQLPLQFGYVTTGLPGHKHRAWLKQMTDEVCDTAPGELTQEMCKKTPQLLSAWSQNPYIRHTRYKSDSDIFPHHGKECAIFCEMLLKRLIDERRAGNKNAVANTEAYNAIIDVWSRSGERGAAAQRAEEILIGMQDAYANGEVHVQPDIESFRLVLKAWSQAKGEEDRGFRAQRLLEWMVSLSDSGENSLAKPDTDCFSIVLSTFAHSNMDGAPQKTEEVILFMDRLYRNGNEKAKPTRIHFNQVLTAWSKCKNFGAIKSAQRAQDILDHMIVLSKQNEADKDLTPTVATYSAVISAWAKSGDDDCGRKAERVLKQAENQYRIHNDIDSTPDTIMFNLVIDGHAKTSSNKAHVRARSLLDRQMKLYNSGNDRCKPDVYSFTSVLSSCASLNGSKKEKLHAFSIAQDTFHDMLRSSVAPNHVTYGTMLKACGRLLPMGKERRQSTRYFFRKACEDGYVGDMVLNRLEEAASPVQYTGLLRGLRKDELPLEWTRKVPERETHIRKNHYFASHSNTATKKTRQGKNDLRP